MRINLRLHALKSPDFKACKRSLFWQVYLSNFFCWLECVADGSIDQKVSAMQIGNIQERFGWWIDGLNIWLILFGLAWSCIQVFGSTIELCCTYYNWQIKGRWSSILPVFHTQTIFVGTAKMWQIDEAKRQKDGPSVYPFMLSTPNQTEYIGVSKSWNIDV